MGQILIRNIDDAALRRLTARAQSESKSLEELVQELLAAAAERPSRMDLVARMDAIRAMSPASSIDATALIRDDRDNR